jgi:L-serine kinase (ATP) / ParB family transcriptional regulator, heme-responsive regulator
MRPARSDDFRLPDLRFVPVDALVPHEQHDPQRLEPLVRGFRDEAVLRNPPIVAELPGSNGKRFMVLDGANRSTAAREAGLPHILVQVASYEEPWVRLTTWHHALSQLGRAEFEAACHRIEGLDIQEESILHARAMLARREALAYAAYPGIEATVFRGGRTLEERNRLLNSLVDVYRAEVRFYRMSTESFDVVRERHPDATTLVVFPHFEPAEVMELAGSGSRLPAGITRHLIRWRALRVNVPMAIMADATTALEEKNRWLAALLEERWNQRQVRFYEESTVLFDE